MAFTKITSKATTTISAGWTAFNNLIDDLLSVVSGKGASQIGVEDSAGNMDAINVETALAEIYSDHSSTRTLAEIFDENSAATTGLTWGYKAGVIRIDNTVTSVSAGTLSLTDDATNYIEITSAGTVSRNTTGFTSGSIPIRQIITVSGVQTTSTDKRAWFTQVAAATGATTASAGIIEIATNAEAIAGTESALAIVPSNLKAMLGDLTDHSLLVGSGASAVTALGAATNGQLPIGSTGADPVLATLTAGEKIAITNAAGTITVATTGAAASGANVDITSLAGLTTLLTFAQGGIGPLGAADTKIFVNAAGTLAEWAIGIKLLSFTRDISTANGTQAVTGVGFKPSHAIFITAVASTPSDLSSIGIDNSTIQAALTNYNNINAGQWYLNTGGSVVVTLSSGNIYSGKVTTWGADGCTITWVKTGSPTGTIAIYGLFFR